MGPAATDRRRTPREPETPVEHGRDEGRQDVGDGAGERDPEPAPARIAEITGVVGDRLGPAENGDPSSRRDRRIDEKGRQNDGADQVDVDKGIEGYPPQGCRRRVAMFQGRPGVGGLVDGDGEEEDEDRDQDVEDRWNLHGLNGSLL